MYLCGGGGRREWYTYIYVHIYIRTTTVAYVTASRCMMYDMTYSNATTYSRVTWLCHMWHHSLIYVHHDSFTCAFTWHTRKTLALPAYAHSQHTNKQMCTYIQACNAYILSHLTWLHCGACRRAYVQCTHPYAQNNSMHYLHTFCCHLRPPSKLWCLRLRRQGSLGWSFSESEEFNTQSKHKTPSSARPGQLRACIQRTVGGVLHFRRHAVVSPQGNRGQETFQGCSCWLPLRCWGQRHLFLHLSSHHKSLAASVLAESGRLTPWGPKHGRRSSRRRCAPRPHRGALSLRGHQM